MLRLTCGGWNVLDGCFFFLATMTMLAAHVPHDWLMDGRQWIRAPQPPLTLKLLPGQSSQLSYSSLPYRHSYSRSPLEAIIANWSFIPYLQLFLVAMHFGSTLRKNIYPPW